jgi:uracil-DNA glycosylase
MKNILDELEKLNIFTSGGNDPRASLSICNNCILKTKPYSLVFYKKTLPSPIPIMFISRDPNIKLEEMKSKNCVSPIDFIISLGPQPRKKGLGWFFNDFLLKNGLWSEFLNFLKSNNPKTPLRFYWTHAVKCYACNDKGFFDDAKNTCIKYLKEEIVKLKPKLIVGCGLEVAQTLYQIKYNYNRTIKFEDLTQENKGVLTLGKGEVIIPHPARALYQRWKKGNFMKVGITADELKMIIDKVIKDG